MAVVSEKILISACLLGDPVRYDGLSKPTEHPLIKRWQQEGRLISVCPEMAGGLPTPRPPAELQVQESGQRLIQTASGDDVTAEFEKGAQHALALCRQYSIHLAVLMARSPSCGSGRIYDGSFSGRLVDGDGVTADLLKRHGIRVLTVEMLDQFNDETPFSE